MLTRIQICNFKKLEDVNFELGKSVVLIGPNNSGKTAALQASALCDHALRASWLQEVVPLHPAGLEQQPHLRDLAGHIAESAAGYFLKSITGLDVAHFPERASEPEVDFILTVGEQRIPLEVKYRSRVGWDDTRRLRSFSERSAYNAPFGVIVTLGDDPATDDPRVVSLPLSTLLLLR